MSQPVTHTELVNEVIVETPSRRRLSDFAGPAVVFALFIGIWYLLSTVILPPQKRFLLPTPHQVITDGFLVWRTGERRGFQPILLSLWDSAKVALIGLCITIVVGMTLAVLMSSKQWLERLRCSQCLHCASA